jgi:hypothetical protein
MVVLAFVVIVVVAEADCCTCFCCSRSVCFFFSMGNAFSYTRRGEDEDHHAAGPPPVLQQEHQKQEHEDVEIILPGCTPNELPELKDIKIDHQNGKPATDQDKLYVLAHVIYRVSEPNVLASALGISRLWINREVYNLRHNPNKFVRTHRGRPSKSVQKARRSLHLVQVGVVLPAGGVLLVPPAPQVSAPAGGLDSPSSPAAGDLPPPTPQQIYQAVTLVYKVGLMLLYIAYHRRSSN